MDLNDIDIDSLPDFVNEPLSTFIDSLAALRDEQFDLLKRCTSKEGIPAGALQHLIIAALRRSTSLIEGFLALADMKNKFCAVPLIRMQLDSAMRVHASRLVNDPAAFVEHILKGGEPRKFKHCPTLDLRDCELHRRLTEKYPLTSDLYRDTNGYVHLSKQHLFEIFDWEGLRSGDFELTDFDALPPWPETDLKGCFLQMIWATHVLTEECTLIVNKTGEPCI